jgi:hypothetical protein
MLSVVDILSWSWNEVSTERLDNEKLVDTEIGCETGLYACWTWENV